MSDTESARPDAAPSALPRVFGRYVLFDQIGRGGMADIFLARADTSLGGSRLCVVKQILPDFGKDQAFERMLIQEAKLAARLSQANVVQVFDLGREGDRLFIAMEYVEGFDLNQLLRQLTKAKVPLPAEFAILIVRGMLSALDYAHRSRGDDGRPLGLVHRDVSPSNVLISFEGEVRLCDFGIARALRESTESGEHSDQWKKARVAGKSAYMAPEHARGEPIDARADVFAAGIQLWELCAGRRLYRGSEEEMLEAARGAAVPELPDRGLPDQPALQKVLGKALARYRDDRYQTAADFLRELEDYAVSNKLMASQLKFGSFLTDNFADEMLTLRRERERAASVLQSEIPPAGEVGESTTVNDAPPSSADDMLPGSGALQGEEEGIERSGWNEPGAISRPAPEPDAGRIEVKEPGAQDTADHIPLGAQPSDDEVEGSLVGLSELAEDARSSASSPPSIPAAPAAARTANTEWQWYAAAAVILAVGVAVYFLR